MLRVTSKCKHIEWTADVQQYHQQQHHQMKSPSTSMRKTRSVDFSRMTIRTTTTGISPVASKFSRRAARGSFKALNDITDQNLLYFSLNQSDDDCSDCTRSVHLPQNDSKDRLLNDLPSLQDDADALLLHETSLPYYQQILSRLGTTKLSFVKFLICIFACATLFDTMIMKDRAGLTSPSSSSRVSLGSAAISSVTETLSPILPFVGGLDLRRNDYWIVSDDGTYFKTLTSVLVQVQDAFAANYQKDSNKSQRSNKNDNTGKKMNNGDSTLSNKDVYANDRNAKGAKLASQQRSSSPTYKMSISASQSFVPLDVIAQLTLGDIGDLFRYARESSNNNFLESKFYSNESSTSFLRQAIEGMRKAIQLSRGTNVIDWTRSSTATSSSIPDEDSDSVDALKFSAAMRVFAEWRLLRQVPDGYKGFAIGMSLGHKDVVQNIIKIEESVHTYLEYQRNVVCIHEQSQQHLPRDDKNYDTDAVLLAAEEYCNNMLIETPTLRQLLSYEVETGVHPSQKLPYLKEKSAGMGLLWVRRQLAYQTQIFDNVLHLKQEESMKNAVGAAYAQVYDAYHGWAVQKIFTYSFQAAPEAEEILRHMNPRRLKELEQEVAKRNGSVTSKSSSNGNNSNTNNNPIGQFIDHVGGEWDKFLNKILNRDVESPESTSSLLSVAQHRDDDDDEIYITNAMIEDAHVQIQIYLTRIQPILNSIQTIFDDYNMNDPTRV